MSAPTLKNHPTANIVKFHGFHLFSFASFPAVSVSQQAWDAYLTCSVGVQVPVLLITSHHTVCEVAVSSDRVSPASFGSQHLRILCETTRVPETSP